MKIAYVLNTYPQPSHSFIRRELRALEDLGHEVHRFAMRAADGPLPDAQDREEQTRTHYVLASGAGALIGAALRAAFHDFSAFRRAVRAAWQLGRVAETSRPRHLIYLCEAAHVAARCRTLGVDHMHAHFGTNAAAVAMLAALMGGPKFSFTVHGPEEFDAPRALALGAKIAAADFTVAISQFGRSQLCRWADPADWARLKVVHCGIEPSKFEDPQPLLDGPRRLVAIGRLVEQKGQLALVQAMARTREEVQLTLVGDGEMRPQIEAEIARHGLEPRVTLTGWADEARVKEELDRAHALVMPSFAEGLPMVIMEAMAAARPVIATYIAGTPELVQDGKTGWLVPAGDVESLARAIDRVARTPLAKLEEMGTAGRARVLERHNVRTEAAKLSAFIAGESFGAGDET